MRSPTHDDVIQDGDTHNLPCFVEATGYGDVLGGWLSIAAWVVMANDNGYGAASDGIAKDLPWMNQRGCVISD